MFVCKAFISIWVVNVLNIVESSYEYLSLVISHSDQIHCNAGDEKLSAMVKLLLLSRNFFGVPIITLL